jgi:hypothetical protein
MERCLIIPKKDIKQLEIARKRLFKILGKDLDNWKLGQILTVTEKMYKVANRKYQEIII